MKLSLDCTFPANAEGKKLAVPIKFVRIGVAVMDKLVEQLQAYRYDDYVELIRIRFTGGERMAFMIVSAVISIRLFDLQADSRRTIEREDILDIEKTVAADAIERNARAAGDQVNAAIHGILGICKRDKIRFVSGHKVVEPA